MFNLTEQEQQMMMQFFLNKKDPEAIMTETYGKTTITLYNNGIFFYSLDGELIHHGFSTATTEDGRIIDTKEAKFLSSDVTTDTTPIGTCKTVVCLYEQGDLQLQQIFCLYEDGKFTVQVKLHDTKGTTKTRYLAPFSTPYPDAKGKKLFLSLDQKMLQVPYDNDMWLRYQSSVPQCGQKSYDVTAIYNEDTEEGLIVGAIDHDVWKNAITWGSYDARTITAFSGVADAMTHDICPHGIVEGEWVASARFVIYWTESIKTGMEEFGDICVAITPPRPWKNGKVPFGWNSFSGLGMELQISHWEEAGAFYKEQVPHYAGEDGVTYINLDGALGLDDAKVASVMKDLQSKGQKAGWYASICNWIPGFGEAHIEGTDYQMKDILLRDENGNTMPKIDGTISLDTTHPAWEAYARNTIKKLVDLGVDYIKIDFLTHGSLEGDHYDKKATGRMALNHAYSIVADEVDKADKEIFISLSIAPLFPYFLGNARRCCCDAFGHHEDSRYVLNALNYAWWTNGRLYQYNDPDHVTLYHSVIDGRESTTIEEARSRYCSAIISGTVMMLSDNYGPVGNEERIAEARRRTIEIANNEKLNEIARFGKAFVPVYIQDSTTPYYTLTHNGRHFAAIFNFKAEEATLSFPAKRGRLPQAGRMCNLITGDVCDFNETVSTTLAGWDATVFEIFPAE